MMVYAQLYKPRRLTLFYPHHGKLPNGEGLQAKYRINEVNIELQIVSFDIACGKDEKERLRSILFDTETCQTDGVLESVS